MTPQIDLNVYAKDHSTIFSIVPFEINEFKPGLYPGRFIIPACKDDKIPTRVVIGGAIHYRYVPDNPKPDAVEVPSYRIAPAIVSDYLDGQLWTTAEAKPGLCWLPGEISLEDFIKHIEYKRIKSEQVRWFTRIVDETTNDWKRYKTYKVVSDQARFAAMYLGRNPEWLSKPDVVEMTNCPACGTTNAKANAVCVSCSCILDKAKYEKLEFARK